ERIDRVDERDLAGDQLRLVALEPPDEVPLHAGQLEALGRELLRVALAEIRRARRGCRPDRLDGMRLAHGDDRDARRIAAGTDTRRLDAATHGLPAFGDRGHAGDPAANRGSGPPS